MHCILCKLGIRDNLARANQQPTEYNRPQDSYRQNLIPEPIIYRNRYDYHDADDCDAAHYDGRGPAPGSRHPILTDALFGHRPGTPSAGIDRYVPQPVTMKSPVAPTDLVNRFTRTQAEGGSIRWVREQYVIPGGPAGGAQGLYGPIHNESYITIADTMKPAQQLPRYNLAATDPNELVSNARKSLLRTLYGVGG